VGRGDPFELSLLAGAPELLRAHAAELPQRDDLCGAFCSALALRAAGLERAGGEPLDQDTAALAAGSVIAGPDAHGALPHGQPPRRDYRLALPTTEDPELSGTTAAGVVAAIDALAGGSVVAVPLAGPWTAERLDGAFDLALACERPVTLIANLATHHLWGARPPVSALVEQLLRGAAEGPPPDWDVGHFACVFGRVRGPGGDLYALADTYPALGYAGIHLQPAQRLAAAVDRPDKPAGGVIVAVDAEEADRLRSGAAALGLQERLWDNGTIAVRA
jgi:hypothetical protein